MKEMTMLAILFSCAAPALAGEPPSRPGVDAPELAHLGDSAVGVKTLHLVQHGQIDVLRYAADKGAVLADRPLTVELWYPALAKPGAPRVVYAASLPAEPPAPPARFSIPGI